ncbi:MAG: hypothetical protein J7L15_06305 [Clostridiales bacterium]|nr:hypothetical protein [Clostridiales bacterium]
MIDKIALEQNLMGQWKVVDDSDNEVGSPLITFHNEFNDKELAKHVLCSIVSFYQKKNKNIKIDNISRFELIDLE